MLISPTRFHGHRLRFGRLRNSRLCNQFARNLWHTHRECSIFPSSHAHATNAPPQQNRAFISLFSHFLLLDALVSTCARLLVLELFFNTSQSQDTCSDTIEAIWTDQKQPSHDVIMSPEWQQALFKAGLWCQFALGAVHVASVGVLICTCAAQGTVAVAVRSYGLQVGGSPEQDIPVDQKDYFCEEFRDVKEETMGEK